MRNFRSNLSRLRTKIENSLPDDDDIYGYDGFSKKLFIDEIEMIYSLSREIEVSKNVIFETIYLERKLGTVSHKLKEAMDLDNPEYKFKEFIDQFAELSDKAKQAYSISSKEGLFRDKELIDISADIKKLKDLHKKYNSEIDEIREINTEINQHNENISEISESLSNINDTINEYESNITEKKENFEQIYENVEGWDEEIKESQTEILLLKKEVNTLQATSTNISGNLNLNEERYETLLKKMKSQEEKNSIFLENIEKTLSNANRIGMAGSFKERKDEISKSQTTWLRIFIFSLIALSILSTVFFIVFPINDSFTFTLDSLSKFIIRIAIISPILWLAWFASKQYSLINKIREDYSYKYASSMAYEGYKKAADECDEDLAQKLLESSMNNISLHPIRLFSKSNDYTTPFSETIDSVLNQIAKFKQISIKIPGLSDKVDLVFNESHANDEES